jgi:hypothetical protein
MKQPANVHRMTRQCFAGFAILLTAQRLMAADFHVAPSGDDLNDGKTPQSAFKTLAAACGKVSAGKHTIQVAAGVYEERQSLLLPPGVSLVGAGAGKTVLEWKATHSLEKDPMDYEFSAFLIQVKDSTDASISGFTINGDLGDGKRAHGGIVARDVARFSIHDCELRGLEFCGVWLFGASHSSVGNCRFNDCAHPSKQSCSGALQVGQLTDCEIHHNVIREHRGAYGIKTWHPAYKNHLTDWHFLGQNKISLVRVKFHHNDIKVRQQGGWGNGQPNMALELWNSEPAYCEIHHNRINECVSLVHGAEAPRTIRVHHNLFLLEPGYSYAIEAGHHNLEIDHNVFRNGYYPIANFAGPIRNLNIHDNTFDGIEDIAVVLMPGLIDFRFTHNTVVVKKDIPLLKLEKFSKESSNLQIANNVLVKEGGEPLKSRLLRFKEGEPPSNVTVTDNAFWNWDPTGDKSPQVIDPGLERSPDGDHLLRLKPGSKVLSAGIGNRSDSETGQ